MKEVYFYNKLLLIIFVKIDSLKLLKYSIIYVDHI